MNYNASKGLIRDSLPSQIAGRLVNEINQGVYRPGELLPSEYEFSQEFGVSRSVIREALTALSAQGYIEVKNGKRAVVLDVNDEPLRIFFTRVLNTYPESLLDLLEVRKALETKSAELAAKRATEEDIARLKSVLDEMAANVNKSEVYSELDIYFHIELARCSRNSYLFHLVNSIRNMLVDVVKELQMVPSPVNLSETQRLHKKVFEAVAKGDPDEAVRAMAYHFDDVVHRIMAVRET